MSTKNIVKYVISAGIAAVMLYFSFRETRWNDFTSALKLCKWEWVALAMAAGVMSFWLRALRWRGLLRPIDSATRCGVTFNAINIGYMANLVLPRFGEFVRCGFITAHSSKNEEGLRRASYDKVLGTVVLERSWDVLTLMLLLLLLMALRWDRFGAFFRDRMLRPVSGGIDAGNFLVLSCIAVACLAAVFLIVWKYGGKWQICRRIHLFAKGLWQGMVSCFRMEKGWTFVVYTMLIWLMYWFMSYSVLLSLQEIDSPLMPAGFSDTVDRLSELGAADALFLMLAGSLSSLVPVPGGFGAFHYIVASALSTVYGIPFGTGIVFATLSHESQVITQIVCGFASYISETFHHSRR